MTKTPEDFAVFLNDLLEKSTDTNTIDLVAAPCGAGKSYSLTYQIGEALRDYNKRGIILVTDEVQRMEEYPNNELNSHLYNYINRNRDRILIYKSDNAKSDYTRLFTTQIVIISTQRFFNMTKGEVKQLTESHIPKRHIFVDERAPLQDVVTINQRTINDIDSMLKTYIDNTRTNKEWVLYWWNKLRERVDSYIREYEKRNNKYELCLIHYDSFRAISDNDEKLKRLLFQTYYNDLRGKMWNYRQKVQAIFNIVEQPALFVSHKKKNSKDKKSDYDSHFVTVLDHSDLLLNVGSKSVILDATGNIDPVYDMPCINRVDCSQFKRNLSNLTINIVDISTSKTKIAENPKYNKNLKAVIQYVKTLPKVDIVFTYTSSKNEDSVEKCFAEAGFRTDHFGNLRGTNKYRDLKNIVQVGLHRFRDEHYDMLALSAEFDRYIPGKKSDLMNSTRKNSKTIMLKSILTDLEQNIFRGVIRNAGSCEKQTYTVLFACNPSMDKNGNDTNDLTALTDMIKNRFGKLGAKVRVIETPDIIRESRIINRNTEKMTVKQRIFQFWSTLKPSEIYTIDDILAYCEVTSKQFWKAISKAKDKEQTTKKKLQSMRIGKGIYQMPAQ